MTERNRLLTAMAEQIIMSLVIDGIIDPSPTQDDKKAVMMAADAALRVIESPPDPAEKPTRICTCGQNGYPENHWNSNHPHTEDCPQYAKAS